LISFFERRKEEKESLDSKRHTISSDEISVFVFFGIKQFS